MIRSLVVLDRLPYPPMGGQQLRYRQAIEALSRLGPVTLLLLASGNPAAGEAGPIPATITVDPEVARRGLYRWSAMLGPRGKKRVRALLRQRFQNRLRQRLAVLLAEAAPDLVVVESAELMPYLPPLTAPGRRVVYDAHNVEKLLWSELVPLRGRLGAGPGSAAFRQRILAGEAALVAGADQIWACSEEDAERFRAAYPERLPAIAVVPNAVDTAGFAPLARARRPAPRGPAEPTVLFTGNFGYTPNVEAARILLDDLRPRLRRSAPGLRIVLCGRQPPPELLMAAAEDPLLTVTGEVPDVRPWFARADLVVVPLRLGGGTRLKILEALAAGCPVVSTPKGAEGLRLEPGLHLLLGETVAELAEAVLWCLHRPDEALAMARRGRDEVERLYSWQANEAKVRAALGLLKATSPKRTAPARV